MLQSKRMEFSDWLKAEIKQRDWSQADLARASGLSEAAVSRLLSKSHMLRIRRQPGRGACEAIARALGYPLTTVYQAAGYLPNGEEVSKRRQMIEGLAEHLDEEDYQDLLEYIEFRRSKSKSR